MTELIDRPRPDTTDMKAVHQVFRATLGEAAELIETVATGDTARSATVGTYYANVLALLHAHHQGEDELIWPVLTARSGTAAAEVQRIAAQHADVDVAVQRAETLLTAWTAIPDPAVGASLVAGLADLRRILCAHLDEEEAFVLPLAAEHLSVEEWGQLPGHSMRTFTGDKLWLILGLVRSHMTQTQRDEMLAHMPPPVVTFWLEQGEPAFHSFCRELRP